jgi:hypothetical protein
METMPISRSSSTIGMCRKPSSSMRSRASAIFASGPRRDRVGGHPPGHRMTGGVVLGGERAHDIALSEDAVQRLAVDDQGRADVLDAHHLRRFGDRRVGRHRHEQRAHHVSKGLHARRSA